MSGNTINSNAAPTQTSGEVEAASNSSNCNNIEQNKRNSTGILGKIRKSFKSLTEKFTHRKHSHTQFAHNTETAKMPDASASVSDISPSLSPMNTPALSKASVSEKQETPLAEPPELNSPPEWKIKDSSVKKAEVTNIRGGVTRRPSPKKSTPKSVPGLENGGDIFLRDWIKNNGAEFQSSSSPENNTENAKMSGASASVSDTPPPLPPRDGPALSKESEIGRNLSTEPALAPKQVEKSLKQPAAAPVVPLSPTPAVSDRSPSNLAENPKNQNTKTRSTSLPNPAPKSQGDFLAEIRKGKVLKSAADKILQDPSLPQPALQPGANGMMENLRAKAFEKANSAADAKAEQEDMMKKALGNEGSGASDDEWNAD